MQQIKLYLLENNKVLIYVDRKGFLFVFSFIFIYQFYCWYLNIVCLWNVFIYVLNIILNYFIYELDFYTCITYRTLCIIFSHCQLFFKLSNFLIHVFFLIYIFLTSTFYIIIILFMYQIIKSMYQIFSVVQFSSFIFIYFRFIYLIMFFWKSNGIN